MVESIIRQALERDELDVIEVGDVIIVYGTKNSVVADVFFIMGVQQASNQF